jgi:hypothetical protein
MNRDEMSNLYRGPSKDALYQVSIHLAKRFQRKRLLEIDQSETRIVLLSKYYPDIAQTKIAKYNVLIPSTF